MIISAALSAADDIRVVVVAGFCFINIYFCGVSPLFNVATFFTQQVAIIADVWCLFLLLFCMAIATAEFIVTFYPFLCKCMHFGVLWVKSSHRTMHGVNVILNA